MKRDLGSILVAFRPLNAFLALLVVVSLVPREFDDLERPLRKMTFIVLAAGVVVVLIVRTSYRTCARQKQRRGDGRVARGLCARCGYDLRATPEHSHGVTRDRTGRQFVHGRLGLPRRVIHNAAAPASAGPLRSIMDNVGNGISGVIRSRLSRQARYPSSIVRSSGNARLY